MRIEINNILNCQKRYFGMFVLVLCSIILFACAAFYESIFDKIMSVATYLTWHNLFEYISSLASFSIFIVTYYTYDGSRRLRMVILGCVFFVMGSLDIFHTLSFMGMPDFFIPNNHSNRATTLWILSRVIGSAGILISSFIPIQQITKIKKIFFVVPTLLTVAVLFFIVTYFPKFFPVMFVDGKGLTLAKISLEYLVVLFMVITFLKVVSSYRQTDSIQEYQFMLGILLSIFSEIAFVSYASVYDIYNYLGHIYKFLAYFIFFKSIYSYNVKIPYREMKKARNELRHHSEKLNFLVKQRTKELEDINEMLLMDLEYAKDIQLSLLPSKMPEEIAVSFEAGYLPADRLSGDFYNVTKLDENNFSVYIGDVSGHGVSAAMLTIFANQNLKPLRETEDSVEIISPGYALKGLYKAFNQTNFKDETYMVMVCGIYNTQSRCFTYASAGINVPPLIIKNTGEISEMDVRGFAICKLGEIIMPFFEDKKIQLEQGDKILFYTDGLVEAENLKGDKYTYDNLVDIIKTNQNMKGSSLKDAINKDFFDYIGENDRLKDDVTFLVMEVS